MKKQPYYRMIHEQLREQIRLGVYPGGSYLPSERALGEKYSVDRITVRKALELLVEEGMVEKKPGIGTQVRESLSQSLAVSGGKNILFVLPGDKIFANRITDVFNAALFFQLEKQFRRQGYTLIYASAGRDDTLSSVAGGNALCAVIAVSPADGRILTECVRSGLPAVAVGGVHELVPSIIPDNAGGMEAAVTRLHGLGHRKIGFILGEKGYYSTEERLRGFTGAMARIGLQTDSRWMAEGHWTYEGGCAAMESILTAPLRPTAVVASNDIMAIGAIRCLGRHGLSVPADMSVIGFDNIEQCEYTLPRLTSVDANLGTMAQAIHLHLMEGIEKQSALPCRIMTPARLIERESTSPPPTAP